jgi:hypothetical protein
MLPRGEASKDVVERSLDDGLVFPEVVERVSLIYSDVEANAPNQRRAAIRLDLDLVDQAPPNPDGRATRGDPEPTGVLHVSVARPEPRGRDRQCLRARHGV